ncbi:MAG: hypothetical protein LBI42_09255 [Chitinispirillales bacterium]|jgi:hypothetical protein|nr:hypothetical protein [Chitinispirillales bacterium]
MSIRKRLVTVALITFVMSGTALAQAETAVAVDDGDETEAVAEAYAEEEAEPAPAPPASVVAPMPVAAVEKPAAKAGLEVKPYGDAQYRFRGAIQTRSNDDESQSGFDYSNRFSWRAGVRAKVDDQLSLQFQVGNDWAAAENVQWSSQGGRSSALVHLAYGTWNPGYMSLSVGVVPVNSHGPLDLLERSLNLHNDVDGMGAGNYAAASHDGWSTRQNNSLMGVKVGAPIVKGDIKVGAELLTSVTRPRTQSVAATKDKPKANPSAALFILDLPVSAGNLKVTPQAAAVLNRVYNTAEEEGDHEMIFGGSVAYKISSALSVNAMGAYGSVSDENASDKATFERVGTIFGVGCSYNIGPGAVQLEYKMSTAEDKKIKDSDVAYHYIDGRYTIKVHSKFTIAPRWRTYITSPGAKNSTTSMENRPELTFTASF